MPVTFPPARITQLTIFMIAGATALSVAACGTPNNTKPSTSASPASSASMPTSSPSASAKGSKSKEWVYGLISSVSDNAVQVTRETGTATVDFTPSTKISEVTSAQLTDVTTGSCVRARPTSESTPAASGAITAQSVNISQAVDGKCPQPKALAGASTTTAPPAPPPGGPEAPRPVLGAVASVAGNTIVVTTTDANGNPSQTNVTVTDTTKYTKKAPADTKALTQGKCISARGTKDDSGTLQATKIVVRPADNGACPQPVGKHPH
jgi:hypothetical protein